MKKILKTILSFLAKILLSDKKIHWFLNKMAYFQQDTEGVIIVRPDNIGDYILFRNFLPYISTSEKFQKPLILIGNKAWRDLAEHFDQPFIHHFIWVNELKYRYNEWYRFFILIKLSLVNFSQIINPVHSRTQFINKLIRDIIQYFPFKNKISSVGDAINLPNTIEKELSDTLFDSLLPSLSNYQFEFYRNKLFVEHLIGKKITLDKPFFEGINKHQKPNQILIFPSASAPQRRWNTQYFAELIVLMDKQFPHLEFLILGNKNDYNLGKDIIKNVPNSLSINKIRNLCGKTSLVELVQIIADSRLLISNETSAVHIAAAVNTPTICISNGNHFGRFNPYPINRDCSINYFYPNEQFNKEENWNELIQKYQYQSELNINLIKPEMIFPTIISILIDKNK